jgi:hypothetical protein
MQEKIQETQNQIRKVTNRKNDMRKPEAPHRFLLNHGPNDGY